MDAHKFTECDLLNYELWIAGTVCAVGWGCFVLTVAFLTTAMCFEQKRLKKTQTDIIIFRTSSRNAILEASLLSKAQGSPSPGANSAYVQSPVAASNFQLQPPPFRRSMQRSNEERVADEVTSPRIFPNSISYTSTTVPLESQVYHSQTNSNFNMNIPSPPPVPPKWQ